ncbi:MAG: 30S ribosomal protein S17e [Methanonatronarchaeales archaeon]|nr:30S ribosomal protein S17e [Methanonatronarchaeales archaeon]
MGRVRPTLVKSIGQKLTERYPNAFSDDFEENKDTVDEYAEVKSKHLRNRIAGYVTHLKELEQKQQD